jgi:type I restriction enzyme S subunit
MKNKWSELKLSEFAEIKMGQSPESKYYNSKGNGLPFLQGNRTFGLIYPTIDTWCTNPIKIAKQDSVIMSVRAPVGDLNIANIDYSIGRGLCSITMNNNNNRFLFYMLKANLSKILMNESGTVFGSINKNVLENLNFNIPYDLKTQKKISEILSIFDEKIEINNKIIKNLEELAQTIYKRWFIDFEFPNKEGKPYKSSGGEMVDSELGPIPKGWEIKNLGQVFENVRDKLGANELQVLSAVKEGKLILSSEFFQKDVPSKNKSKYLIVRKNYFAYNPARINIGSIGINEYDFDGCVSPVYVVLRTKEEYYRFFLIYFKTKAFISEVILRSSGSVRQSLDFNNFALIKIVYPKIEVVNSFNIIFDNFKEKIKITNKENLNLSELRDLLLPKLMSGEIEVQDME